MRKTALLVCSLFVVGLIVAQAHTATATAKTHNLSATVVSVDLEGKKITIKDDKGETKTAPVLAEAIESLKTVKTGDRVTLTCKDNDKGEHEGVTAIKIDKV